MNIAVRLARVVEMYQVIWREWFSSNWICVVVLSIFKNVNRLFNGLNVKSNDVL